MNQSLLLLLATIITSPTTITTFAMQPGCRTTTSTQSITCTTFSCTPLYEGGCNGAEYQEDSTQTYCNVEGDTTTCGYSVVCCSPQSNNNHGGGGGMVAQSSSPTATCGNGNRGNAICPIQGECCSEFGWCGTTPDHCGGNNGNNNNYNANKNQAAASSDWWDSEAVYKKDPSTSSTTSSTTQYSNTYSSTWNGQQLPSAQQQLRSESTAAANNVNRSYATSPAARQAGAGAGLGFAFVVIVIAGCHVWRREQDRADCPGGTDVVVSRAVLDRLDPDGGSLAMRYGIDDSSDDDEDSSDGNDGRSRRSRKVGRDPSVYGQFSRGQSNGGGIDADVEDDGRSKKSASRRTMGRDPSVRFGGSSNGSGSGSGGSRRHVVDDDARSHRSSTKSKRGGGGRRDPSINNGGSNGSGSNGSTTKKKTKKKKPQYPAPAPPRPPPTSLHRKLSNSTKSTSDSDSRKQRQEWVKKTIYDTGSEDEEGLDDDTDSQLNWAA